MVSPTSLRLLWSVTIISWISSTVNPTLANEEVIQAIEKQAAELPINSFEFDTTVVQQVDHVNNVTTYRLPLLPEATYIRENTDDSLKNVVVLADVDDQVAYKNHKRIYIVLRRKQAAEYFVTAAAIRDSSALDKDLAKISSNGKEYILEWLNFDHHLFPTKNILMLRAYYCVFSYVSPCGFNASVLTPPEKFVKSPGFIAKAVDSEASQYITTDGSDAADNYNFYADLEIHPKISMQSGRFVAGVVGAVVGGAFGITCGVLGAVFGFGASCNPAPITETVIVHEQLPPVMGPPMVLQGLPGGPGGGMAAAAAAAAAHMGRMAPQSPFSQGGNQPPPGYPGYQQQGPPGYPPQGPPGFPPQGYPGGQQMQGRRKRNAIVPEPLDDYPGWKTQFTVPTVGSSLAHENDIFFGFGNCPPTTVDPKELESATTDEQIINFYLKVLRADCLLDRVILLPKLIADGVILIADKELHVNLQNPRYSPKMALRGFLEMSTAAELCVLTRLYREETKTHDATKKFTTPDGQKNISRSINFLTNFVYKYLTNTRTQARLHMIKATRNIVMLLNSIFDKVRQDQSNLEKCSDCKSEKEINSNDRLQVVGLLEFVKFGISPVDRGQDPQKTFTEFFTKNLAILSKLA